MTPALIHLRTVHLLLAIGALVQCGCDPVRSTSQRVTISVHDPLGQAVPNAKISIKESWKSWQSWAPQGVDESDSRVHRKRWESDFVPWLKGVSDAQGEAILESVETAIDGSSGRKPPASRDWISSREYVVKLQLKDVVEECRVVMKPGMSARAGQFVVTVDAIEKPRYVKTR